MMLREREEGKQAPRCEGLSDPNFDAGSDGGRVVAVLVELRKYSRGRI
jgi:hypothetical protein